MGKYFTSTCKPTIAASKQHAGAFSAGHVLFDWTELEVPKGTSCIRSVTMLTRPKGDAGPTANQFTLSLLYSTSDTTSLGTVRAAPDKVPNDDIIGVTEFSSNNYARSSVISTSYNIFFNAGSITSSSSSLNTSKAGSEENVVLDNTCSAGSICAILF